MEELYKSRCLPNDTLFKHANSPAVCTLTDRIPRASGHMERTKVGCFGKCFIPAVRSNSQGNATGLSIVLSVSPGTMAGSNWLQRAKVGLDVNADVLCSRCEYRCTYTSHRRTNRHSQVELIGLGCVAAGPSRWHQIRFRCRQVAQARLFSWPFTTD